MRFLTFQSKEVVDQILKYGGYKADQYKTREPVDEADLNSMGDAPIWVYAHPLLADISIEVPKCHIEDMLEAFRCHMNMEPQDFTKLYCIEFDPDYTPLSSQSVVQSRTIRMTYNILKDDVIAIYKVLSSKESEHLYGLEVTTILKGNAKFPNGFSCTLEEYERPAHPFSTAHFKGLNDYNDVERIEAMLLGTHKELIAKRQAARRREHEAAYEKEDLARKLKSTPNRFCLRLLPGRKVMRDAFYSRFMLYCQDLSIPDDTFCTIMSYLTIASCWNNGDHSCVDDYSRIIVERANAIKLGANKILSDFVQQEVTVDDIVDIIIP